MSRFVEVNLSDPAKFDRLVQNLGAISFIRYLQQVLEREGKLIVSHIRRTQFKGGKTTLARRSGLLARSIRSEVEIGTIPQIRVGVFEGAALSYAAIQEYGTKDLAQDSPFSPIVPKRAKALAVPVPDGPAVDAAGLSKYKSPRDFPGKLRFIPLKGGNLVGALVQVAPYQKRPRGSKREINLDRAKFVYLLLSKVSLRPGRFLRRGIAQQSPRLARNLSLAIKDYIERA